MPVLTADDFDVANVLIGIGLAGAVLLGIQLAQFGWRKLLAFFR